MKKDRKDYPHVRNISSQLQAAGNSKNLYLEGLISFPQMLINYRLLWRSFPLIWKNCPKGSPGK